MQLCHMLRTHPMESEWIILRGVKLNLLFLLLEGLPLLWFKGGVELNHPP